MKTSISVSENTISFLKLIGLLMMVLGIGFGISMNAAGMAVYGIALLWHVLFLRRSSFVPLPEFWLLAFFGIFLCFNFAVHHEYPWTSFRGFWKYAGGYLVMYSVLDVARSRERLALLLQWTLAVFGVAVLAALWQKWAGYDFVYFRHPYVDEAQVRLSGTFKHYNDFGTFLVPCVIVSMAFLIISVTQKKKLSAFFGSVLFLAAFFVLVNTFSRSAFFSVVFGLLFCFFSFKSKKRILVVLLALMVALALFNAPFRSRFEDIFNLAKGSASERLLLAKISMAMMLKNPWIGWGMNTYSIYYPQFKPANYAGLMYAHNSYLQLGTEIGITGLLLYLLYIAACLRRAWGRLRGMAELDEIRILTVGFLGAVIGLLTNSVFESLLQSTQLRALFWLMMGAIMAAVAINGSPDQPENAGKQAIDI